MPPFFFDAAAGGGAGASSSFFAGFFFFFFLESVLAPAASSPSSSFSPVTGAGCSGVGGAASAWGVEGTSLASAAFFAAAWAFFLA